MIAENPYQRALRRVPCRLKQLADALHSPFNILSTVGIGEADKALPPSPETRARDGRHVAFVEKEVLGFTRGQASPCNIRERVKRTRRIGAAYTRQTIQGINDQRATLIKRHHHLCGGILRASQCRQTRKLRGGINAGVVIDTQTRHISDEVFGPHGKAQAPARHGVGLAPTVQKNQTVTNFWVIQ